MLSWKDLTSLNSKMFIPGSTYINGIYIPPPIKPHCSMEAGGPRLMITHIENENFKSYAGIVHLGPFHHVSDTFCT